MALGISYSYFTHYRSAFEADQKCHYELLAFSDSTTIVGCDHDIETKQWILFEKSHTASIAHVIKRYRY